MIIQFEDARIQIVDQDGDPWFALTDACLGLGIKQPAGVARRLDEDEKGVILNHTLGGPQPTVFVSLAGLSSVIVRSREAMKPGTFAYRFRRWLMHEVVPSIMRYGCYPPPPPAPPPPVFEDPPRHEAQKSLATRFREERERWEAETGYVLATTVPEFSKAVVRAIEEGRGGLSKGQRFMFLHYAGLDVQYIMTGTRYLSLGERAWISAYRDAEPEQKQAMLASIPDASLRLPQLPSS